VDRSWRVVAGRREIVLDVYASKIVDGDLDPKEHAETRWIVSEDVTGLDWAEVDRPILPALRRALAGGDFPVPQLRENAG
jgi:hypothetical protein